MRQRLPPPLAHFLADSIGAQFRMAVADYFLALHSAEYIYHVVHSPLFAKSCHAGKEHLRMTRSVECLNRFRTIAYIAGAAVRFGVLFPEVFQQHRAPAANRLR